MPTCGLKIDGVNDKWAENVSIVTRLNKAGRLKVYIRSARNVLIEVHPETRVPRTARRFYGLMSELLSKLKVRGTSGAQPSCGMHIQY